MSSIKQGDMSNFAFNLYCVSCLFSNRPIVGMINGDGIACHSSGPDCSVVIVLYYFI